MRTERSVSDRNDDGLRRILVPAERIVAGGAVALALGILWAGCFVLSLRSALGGAGMFTVIVSAGRSADLPPVVTSLSFFSLGSAASSGLRPGDRLLRLGDVDLRGVGRLGLLGAAAEVAAARHDGRVAAVFERDDGERGETLVPLYRYARLWPLVAASSVFALAGLLLLARARADPSGVALAQVLLCYALFLVARTFGASRPEVYASVAVLVLSATLAAPLSLRAIAWFPRAPAAESLATRVGPWAFAVFGLLWALFFLDWLGYQPFLRALNASSLAFDATLVVVATRKYQGFDPIRRRQSKWLLLGIYCALLVRATTGLCYTLAPASELASQIFIAGIVALALIPLSLLVGIARYNLFDIDRLLSAAASYNLVLVVGVAVGLLAVPRLAEATSSWIGVDPGTGQIALSLALAALVVPAHRRLRPQIERVFFRERYAIDLGIGDLLTTLSICTDARDLTQRVGEGLVRLFRPEACVVYAVAGTSYQPIFVAGRAVPPAFDAASPLVRTLAERRAPLARSDAGRRPDAAALGPFDRAALETLEAEVVVPVRRENLAAFLCLGPRRSGDVYTPTDLSLLTAVAETVSHALRRLDQEDVLRDARAMQESLRRYVPGAVAEQLASGAELVSSEREVSVLFVDIRGYTSFSEPRRAEDIFSTVNRYTETVSQIVRLHGGSIVEFNGDGLMAVFGAPRDLPHKERAAVEAGREIATAVGALPLEEPKGGTAKLSVGVGIATGEDFVGNIQAADRTIWTAVGNTTNLAARLQALTRQLDAAMVIDAATWRTLGLAANAFQRHPTVAIRGRSQMEDVYTLPLERA